MLTLERWAIFRSHWALSQHASLETQFGWGCFGRVPEKKCLPNFLQLAGCASDVGLLACSALGDPRQSL